MFRICSRIKKILCFYRNPGHDGSLYDCLFDSMALVQSVDDKAVFVFFSDANADNHSEWLVSAGMFRFSCTKERKEVPFCMAIGNGERMHECFPKRSRLGTVRMK